MVNIRRKQHHIVYIPGLGDSNGIRGQRFAVWLWRTYGVFGHCHPVIWADDQPFDDKLKGVFDEVDGLLADGHIVSIIAASAGASMALHAYAARTHKISGVVLICGELADAKKIAPKYFDENPAFKTSMERLPKTLQQLTPKDRARIMSFHPLYDETVDIKDTVLDGARMYTSISFGHSVTIGLALTIDFYILMWFLLRQTRQTR